MISTTANAAADSLVVKNKKEQTGKKPSLPSTPFIDRLAIRTNAVDWLATVPNIGFDIDLTGSEYNNMTIGFSAKFNWDTKHFNLSTGHDYAPPSAFNILDLRPEFRYWYRTKKAPRTKEKFSIDGFLKNKKNPKTWRANYVGAYVNYGTYTFKAGKKGMQGQVCGIGASTGYSLPLYEYEKFAIDIELGFSVGLQVCNRDMFVHNPDGYFYSKVLQGSKDLHFTPFPVVSDVRVAFVWRHKSIKDKVKEDDSRNKVVRQFNIFQADYNFNDYTKAWYDETLTNTKSMRERDEIMANDSLYVSGFLAYVEEHELGLRGNVPMVFSEDLKSDPRVNVIVMEYEDKLLKLIDKRKKDAIRLFEKELDEIKAEAKKAEAKAEKENPEEKSRKSGKKNKEGKVDDVPEVAVSGDAGVVADESGKAGKSKAKKDKTEKVKAEKPEKEKVEKVKAEKPEKEKVEKVKAEKPVKEKVEKVKAEKPEKEKAEKVKAEKPEKIKEEKSKKKADKE